MPEARNCSYATFAVINEANANARNRHVAVISSEGSLGESENTEISKAQENLAISEWVLRQTIKKGIGDIRG